MCLFFETTRTNIQPKPIKNPWYLLKKHTASDNPKIIRKKLSYFLFFECNVIMLNPTKTIPKFNGPSGTTNKPPEKKKNGAMLYKITDQFPTSGLYNVSPIL